MFKEFMQDKDAWDMYVTGRAGTGKTTMMKDYVQYLIDEDIPYVVCAYTHKACGILREKLPEGAIVGTLHSVLKKRPGVNANATSRKHLEINIQHGQVECPQVLLVDEYSMVGEKDLTSIRELQDEDDDGYPDLKVVWFGDPYQLPPVGDLQSVQPEGSYCLELTKIHRQGADNPLLKPISELVSFIEGAKPHALTTSRSFVRDRDIVEDYAREPGVILAYTNQRVEELNIECQGYDTPKKYDEVFSPTTKEHYKFIGWTSKPDSISLPFGEDLELGTKYRTLEHLHRMDCMYAVLEDAEGTELVMAVVFGHFQYKIQLDELKSEAVAANVDIPSEKPALWASQNRDDRRSKRRAKAWRDFLTFNQCVICIDFTHAMTVHKSQGSTYSVVYVDTNDLARCIQSNYRMYLRLMYVALSRASKKVITT